MFGNLDAFGSVSILCSWEEIAVDRINRCILFCYFGNAIYISAPIVFVSRCFQASNFFFQLIILSILVLKDYPIDSPAVVFLPPNVPVHPVSLLLSGLNFLNYVLSNNTSNRPLTILSIYAVSFFYEVEGGNNYF